MAVDPYKNKLRKAQWNWLEHKNSWYHRAPRNKDRIFGRNDKRAARAEDRREIANQTTTAAERRLAEAEIQADEE